MTASLTRSDHTASLLDGEIVEENDFGSMRRITADNLPAVVGAGADAVAVISAVCGADDPEAATRRLLSLLERHAREPREGRPR